MEEASHNKSEGDVPFKAVSGMAKETTEGSVSANKPTGIEDSDQTAQVLKDIAILNGQAAEFSDDHISTFNAKESGVVVADKNVNGDSGINSVDSAGTDSKVENDGDDSKDETCIEKTHLNGNSCEEDPVKDTEPVIMEVSDDDSKSDDSKSDDSKSDDSKSESEDDDKPVVIDESSSSSNSSGLNSNKEDSDVSSKNPGKDSEEVRSGVSREDTEKGGDSSPAHAPAKVDNTTAASKEVSEVYDAVLEELEADVPGDKSSGSGPDKVDNTVKNTPDPAPSVAVKGAANNGTTNTDNRSESPNTIKISQVTTLSGKPDIPEKKDEPSLKHSKVNQALSRAPIQEMRPMASALASVGLDLLRQYVYKDLVRQQSKKKNNKELNKRENEQLERLQNAQEVVVKKNEKYAGKTVHCCKKCSYTTVSKNQFELHKEHAHQAGYGGLECAMCDFETKNRNAMAFHMEAEHSRQCKWLTTTAAFYVCPLCRFESNTTRQFEKHKLKCDKIFTLNRNLEPQPQDCDIPIRPLNKPKPQPINRKPPQVQSHMQLNIRGQQPNKNRFVANLVARAVQGVAHARPQAVLARNMLPVRQPGNQVQRLPVASPSVPAGQGSQIVQIQGQFYTLFYSQGQAFLTPMAQNAVVPTASQARQLMAQQPIVQTAAATAPRLIQPAQPKQHNADTTAAISSMIAARAIAQAAQGKAQSARANMANKQIQYKSNTVNEMLKDKRHTGAAVFPKEPVQGFEVCEICGGFVKDSDSLRIHFYWAHKIDIPKSVFGKHKPHLKCGRNNGRKECQERFWTYQGLSRHREVAHAESEAPQSNLQTRSCYMCGEQGIVSLIGHLRTQHYLQVGTWLRSSKCVCCGLQFKDKAALENHLLNSHGQVFLTKGLIDQLANFSMHVTPRNGPAVPTGLFPNSSLGKGPGNKNPGPPTGSLSSAIVYPCNSCEKDFSSSKEFEAHQRSAHSFKCVRCPQRFSSREFMSKHYSTHKNDKDKCDLCQEMVQIGRPLVRHMKRTHLKDCVVMAKKLPSSEFEHFSKKFKPGEQAPDSEKKPGTKGSVIVLDSDDEEEKEPSSKRVPDHSTEDEPPAKRARTGTTEEETVTVLELDEEGNHIETESVDSPNASGGQENVEILEVDGETIIVRKEDD